MANHAPKGPLLRAAGVAGLRVAFLRLPMGVYRYKLTFAKNLCRRRAHCFMDFVLARGGDGLE